MFYPPQDDLRVAMKNITDSLKEKSLPSPSLRISQDEDFFLVSLDNVIGRHNITFFRHYYVSNLKCCFEFCVPISPPPPVGSQFSTENLPFFAKKQ